MSSDPSQVRNPGAVWLTFVQLAVFQTQVYQPRLGIYAILIWTLNQLQLIHNQTYLVA
jgi:hypothetical protein